MKYLLISSSNIVLPSAILVLALGWPLFVFSQNINFDDSSYSKAIKEIDIEKAGSAKNILRKIEMAKQDELKAALCWHLRRAYKDNSSLVNVSDIFRASSIVDELYTKHPLSVELLTLRFSYGFAEEHIRMQPFLIIAYPLVTQCESKQKSASWSKELKSCFYAAFNHMGINYSLFMKQKLPFSRTVFLYDIRSEEPTNQDRLMWKTLVKAYASEVNNEKKKWWDSRVKYLEKELPTEGTMTIEEAKDHLAILVSQYQAYWTYGPVLKEKFDQAIEAAYLKGRKTGELVAVQKYEQKIKELSPIPEKLRSEHDKLLSAVVNVCDNWESHAALCEFYAKNHLRQSEEYPPSRFYPNKPSAVLLEARAYYHFIVRGSLSELVDVLDDNVLDEESVEKALAFSDQALNLEAGRPRSLALKAWALIEKNQREDAEHAMAEAMEKGGEDPIVKMIAVFFKKDPFEGMSLKKKLISIRANGEYKELYSRQIADLLFDGLNINVKWDVGKDFNDKRVTLVFHQALLVECLRELCLKADLKYSIEEDHIIIQSKAN